MLCLFSLSLSHFPTAASTTLCFARSSFFLCESTHRSRPSLLSRFVLLYTSTTDLLPFFIFFLARAFFRYRILVVQGSFESVGANKVSLAWCVGAFFEKVGSGGESVDQQPTTTSTLSNPSFPSFPPSLFHSHPHLRQPPSLLSSSSPSPTPPQKKLFEALSSPTSDLKKEGERNPP